MSKPLFIAISGKKGSGKDEFAKQLQIALEDAQYIPFRIVEITHFADPLKEMCIQLFGLNRDKIYGSNEDKEQLTTVTWDGFPLRVRCKYSNDTIKKDILRNEFGEFVVTDDLLYVDGDKRVCTKPRSGPMTYRNLLQVLGTDIFRDRVYSKIWSEYPFKQMWETDRDSIPIDVVLIPDTRFPGEIEETLKHGGLVVRINRNTESTDTHPSETALDNYNWDQDRHFIIDNNGTLEELREKSVRIAKLIRGNYIGK